MNHIEITVEAVLIVTIVAVQSLPNNSRELGGYREDVTTLPGALKYSSVIVQFSDMVVYNQKTLIETVTALFEKGVK